MRRLNKAPQLLLLLRPLGLPGRALRLESQGKDCKDIEDRKTSLQSLLSLGSFYPAPGVSTIRLRIA